MISLKNLTLRRGTKVLLDSANLSLHAGEKVGLVGRNGAGKSSVFALLSGRLHEDGGDAAWPSTWQMAQVAQDMPETSESATEFVLSGDTHLTQLQAQLLQAEAEHDGLRMAHLHSDLYDAGAHDALSRAQALILGLGFAPSQVNAPVNSFSGGWRMRLQLARALMCPSDLLLLDEPTNHLDLDALVWLESWLQKYTGTMVVISHDREFLDAVTQTTVHIDNQQLTRYGGNYSAFETLRAQQLALQQAALAKQQDKIAHLQKFIDRFKAKASKAKQAQSRVKALERMEKIAPMLASADFSFEFKEPANLPNPMLALQSVDVGYVVEGAPKPIVHNINRSVLAGQRIGILGANGQGKSTLVKTVARTLAPLAGQATEGKGLSIGYFAQQELDVLQAGDTPLEHMIALAKRLGPESGEPSREQDLRNFLGRFNFSGDMVSQAVGSMSGGEKARLVLCMIVWQRPNLLLLDEPTNHLDLATREALSVALNEFEGTVMLVSHDRALLRAVCDEFWLVGRGELKPFDGDLDDYQRYLLDEAKRVRLAAKLGTANQDTDATKNIADHALNTRVESQNNAQNTPDSAAKPREQRKQEAQQRQQLAQATKGLRQEVAQLDKQLAALQAEKTALELELAQNPAPARIAQAGKRLKACQDEMTQLEERWLDLSEQLESFSV
jgi:ATP-binding cassette, subfamily F, member 3